MDPAGVEAVCLNEHICMICTSILSWGVSDIDLHLKLDISTLSTRSPTDSCSHHPTTAITDKPTSIPFPRHQWVPSTGLRWQGRTSETTLLSSPQWPYSSSAARTWPVLSLQWSVAILQPLSLQRTDLDTVRPTWGFHLHYAMKASLTLVYRPDVSLAISPSSFAYTPGCATLRGG